MSNLTQADIDQDQAGYFDLMRSCHMKLPSHNGKPLDSCPVCKMFFIQEPHPEGKPVESYKFYILDTSDKQL